MATYARSPRGVRFANSVVSAFGITSIGTFWMVAPLVSDRHDAVYHWSGSMRSLFYPVFRDFFFCWFLLSLFLYLTARSRSMRMVPWIGFVTFLPWIALRNWALIANRPLPRGSGAAALCFGAALFLLVMFFGRRGDRRVVERARSHNWARLQERCQEFSVYMASVAAVIGGFLLCQLVWFGWEARSLNADARLGLPVPAASASHPGHPRVIWILLDELSYQQVYERRYSGLRLPAFDQLVSESNAWTQTIPAGIRTGEVIPSLLTGRMIDDTRSSADGQLTVHDEKEDAWHAFHQHDTVFQDALNAGYRTGISGWYNPYCRVLPSVLDTCFWTYQTTPLGHARLSSSVWLKHIFWKMLKGSDGNDFTAVGHISDYKLISAAADGMLKDSSDDFLFIHMCIPHPIGIYNRATGSYAVEHSTYLDNLVMADRYLGHVRALLEAQGQWDSSAIVVMGDHSWRTKLLWSSTPEWTHEEQVASKGGEFDDRPAYLLKLPNQHAENKIQTPFAAIETRRLLDRIMEGRLRTPDDLKSWVSGLASPGAAARSGVMIQPGR